MKKNRLSRWLHKYKRNGWTALYYPFCGAGRPRDRTLTFLSTLSVFPVLMSMPVSGNVAVFWDYGALLTHFFLFFFNSKFSVAFIFLENCPAPASTSGYAIANSISALARSFGTVKVFKAYLEISDQSRSSFRSELQSSGVSLVDCPHNGRKDVADKMILGQKSILSVHREDVADSAAQLTCYPMSSITLHHLPFFLSLVTATSPMRCQSSRIATIKLYWSNGLILMSA